MKEANNFPSQSKKWLEGLSQGRFGPEFETFSLQGLQVVESRKGLMRCTFVIPRSLCDKDGDWHVGAIATLIDDIAATTVGTSLGEIKSSVDFNISYISTAKFQEEVEIEAKVLNHKGKLSSVLIEVRKKDTREMVALGKQWMSSFNFNIKKASKL